MSKQRGTEWERDRKLATELITSSKLDSEGNSHSEREVQVDVWKFSECMEILVVIKILWRMIHLYDYVNYLFESIGRSMDWRESPKPLPPFLLPPTSSSPSFWATDGEDVWKVSIRVRFLGKEGLRWRKIDWEGAESNQSGVQPGEKLVT